MDWNRKSAEIIQADRHGVGHLRHRARRIVRAPFDGKGIAAAAVGAARYRRPADRAGSGDAGKRAQLALHIREESRVANPVASALEWKLKLHRQEMIGLKAGVHLPQSRETPEKQPAAD